MSTKTANNNAKAAPQADGDNKKAVKKQYKPFQPAVEKVWKSHKGTRVQESVRVAHRELVLAVGRKLASDAVSSANILNHVQLGQALAMAVVSSNFCNDIVIESIVESYETYLANYKAHHENLEKKEDDEKAKATTMEEQTGGLTTAVHFKSLTKTYTGKTRGVRVEFAMFCATALQEVVVNLVAAQCVERAKEEAIANKREVATVTGEIFNEVVEEMHRTNMMPVRMFDVTADQTRHRNQPMIERLKAEHIHRQELAAEREKKKKAEEKLAKLNAKAGAKKKPAKEEQAGQEEEKPKPKGKKRAAPAAEPEEDAEGEEEPVKKAPKRRRPANPAPAEEEEEE